MVVVRSASRSRAHHCPPADVFLGRQCLATTPGERRVNGLSRDGYSVATRDEGNELVIFYRMERLEDSSNFAATDKDIHFLSATFKATGSFTITATDTVTAAITRTSSTIKVT